MPDHGPGPTFICAGLEKCGTTWLYQNLRRHPQVELPRIKELRYFWEATAAPGTSVWQRLRGKTWYHKQYNRYLRQRARYFLRHPLALVRQRRDLLWDLRFLFRPQNDRWYASLFDHRRGLVTGDISPAYELLSEESIDHILSLFPHLRVIILVRNPIERLWSRAKMVLLSLPGRKIEDVEEREFIDLFDNWLSKPSDLVRVQRWQHRLPPDRFMLGFYEELCEDPRRLYQRVCAFLGIDAGEAQGTASERIDAVVNAGRQDQLPPKFARYLAMRYRPSIEDFCRHLEPYPQGWLKQCDALLETTEESLDQRR